MKIIPFIISIVVLTSCSQQTSKINVDESISGEIDTLIVANQVFLKGMKEADSLTIETLEGDEYLFHIKKTYDYQKFRQEDASDINYFLGAQELGQRFDKSDKSFTTSIGYCFLKGDTIILQGGMAYAGGVLFQTKIFGDRSSSEIFLSSTRDVYSSTSNKNKMGKEIILKSTKQELTLTEKPMFNIGDKIKGKAYLKSEQFYQLDKGGRLVKLHTEFEIVFNCEIEEEPVF